MNVNLYNYLYSYLKDRNIEVSNINEGVTFICLANELRYRVSSRMIYTDILIADIAKTKSNGVVAGMSDYLQLWDVFVANIEAAIRCYKIHISING